MDYSRLLHAGPYIISFLISASVASYAWRRRAVTGATPFFCISASQAFWTLGYIFELVATSMRWKIFWDGLENFGTIGWALAFLAFALQYTDRKLSHPWLVWSPAFSLSVIYMALVFTNEFHHLILVKPYLIPGKTFSELSYDFGIASWIGFAIYLVIFLAGMVMLVARLVEPRRYYRAQIITVLIGTLLPLIAISLTLMKLTILFHRDLTPLTFGLSNLVIALGLFRYRLLDLVPISREMLLDQLDDVVVVEDAQHRIVDINAAGLDRLGRKASEVIGRPDTEVWGGYRDIINKFEDINESKTVLLTTERGEKKYNELRVFPLRDRQGKLLGRLGIARDVTAQNQAEELLKNAHEELESRVLQRTAELEKAYEALAASEEKFRFLFEFAPASIIIFDLNGIVLEINEYFKIPKELSIGQHYSEMGFVHPDYMGIAHQVFEMARQGKVAPPAEIKIFPGTANERWVEIHPSLMRKDGTPYGVQVISIDVTERKKLEEQLVQAQKMEAIGRLAGGVAHDFNNQLTVIQSVTEMLEEDAQPESKQFLQLEMIRKAAEQSAALTRQLLAFSRKSIIQPVVLNLNVALSHLEKMLGRIIGEDIELQMRLDSQNCYVEIDPVQLEQVVFNLAVNARDAMAEGGRLTFETQDFRMDKEQAAALPLAPGDYVLLAVSDTGIGMGSKVLSKIFEPFFTTKEVGKGTGLGLSTVYGIIKQANGEIMVTSEPGKGSTFKIFLPRARKAAQPGQIKAGVSAGAAAGSETILVVEDNDAARNLTLKILEGKGYRVLGAASGAEALRIAGEQNVKLNLLLTDVVMPGMNGKELAKRLAAQQPSLKILFVSGYPDNMIAPHGMLEPGVHFLQKPFKPTALLAKVREVLDQPRL